MTLFDLNDLSSSVGGVLIPADDPRHAKRAPVALAFRTNEKVRIR